MSSNPRTPGSRAAAVPAGHGRSSRPNWLLPLVLAVIALIAVLLLLSRCSDDDEKPTATSPTTAAATSTASAASENSASASATAAPSGAGEPGTVTVAAANLLGEANVQNLRANQGGNAVGRGVQVQSVPADEGFWVGTSEQDRLWVQLTEIRGESGYKVKQGDSVNFTGTVTRAAQGFAAQSGVSTEEGADQLTDQGFYLSVPAANIELSD